EHLAIAIGPGADADGRRFYFGGNHGRDFARDTLEIDAGYTGTVERYGIAHELFYGVQRFPLNFVATHDVDRLRSQANVPGNGNLSVDHAADNLYALLTALHFDGFGAAFFHEAGGVTNRVFGVNLIGPVGHVGDEQCVFHSAAHGLYVVQHLIDSDRKRVFVAEHGHGERVADEGDVDPGLVDESRGGIVVGREAGDGLMVKLLFADGRSGDLAARLADRCKTHDVLQCPSANWADRACVRRSCYI